MMKRSWIGVLSVLTALVGCGSDTTGPDDNGEIPEPVTLQVLGSGIIRR